jgi:molecular chaperone DnaJ
MSSSLLKRGPTPRSRLFAALLAMIAGSYAVPGILAWWLFRGRRRARPGPDLLTKVEIDLLDAARGTSRNLAVTRHEVCTECGGSGWRKGISPPKCEECGGRGEIFRERRFFAVPTTCPTCAGQGPPVTDPCPNCRGLGRIPHEIELIANIPPGVASGMWLQLRDQGEPGEIGASRGNLRIQLLVKEHPIFDRRQNDLHCRVAVTDAAMMGGAEVQVPTLDGPYTLRIPRGTRTGDLLRIRGRGMPELGGSGRGDIVVEVVLETPADG